MTLHALILLSVVVFAVACASPAPEPDPPANGRPPPHRERRVAGESRQGRPIPVIVLGEGEHVVLLLATIHGNEAAGTPLLRALAVWLAAHPGELLRRTVVLVPVGNPDGLALGTRTNAAGVDLNRNYPTENFRAGRGNGPKPLSEPESHALYRLITEFEPEIVVSIHQPYGCVDFDGPGLELARKMGRASGLPVRKLGARPGSLGSFVGQTLGRPIVTLELPGRVDGDTAWARYGPALISAVRACGGPSP